MKNGVAWVVVVLAVVGFVGLLGPLGLVLGLIDAVYFQPARMTGEGQSEGEPIVAAVYRFRHDRGLDPDDLNDLVPAYLPLLPPGWSIAVRPGGASRLTRRGQYRSGLTFYFGADGSGGLPPGKTSGWVFDQEGSGRYVGPGASRPIPWTGSVRDRDDARVAELRRRVVRDRARNEAGQSTVSWVSELVRQGRTAEAAEACRDAIAAVPNDRWPRLALAEIESRAGASPTLASLIEENRREPAFMSSCEIARLLRAHGRTGEALDTLRLAASCPVTPTRAQLVIPEYAAYDAARFAYGQKEYDLVLRLCDGWELFVKARGHGERSLLALRAAAQLALGKKNEAVASAEAAWEENRRGALWAENLDALRSAARAGDITFNYLKGWPGLTSTFLDLFHAPDLVE